MAGSSAPIAAGPLAGVRVLDCSRVLAGPYAGRLLADLGAEVVKLEPPAGDEIREVAPRRDRGMSGLYTWANVGKRNVCVDVRKPEGAALALELASRCDAVIENFRPGVADRLGIGWSAIHARSPRTVLVSVNAFGSDSSWRERRGFAHVVHAAAGILHDQAERTGQPVAQLAQAFGDVATALHATVALLAALRVAAETGEGQHVEVAMFDATLASYTETSFALLDPPEARDTGLLFDAGRHGVVAVAGARPHVWRVLRERHGLADPAPPGADVPTKARLRNEAIEAFLAAQPSREALVAAVEAAGLACAPVAPLREALTGPLARERGLLAAVDDRRGATRPVVRSPWRFSRSEARVRGPAPRRGEHNGDVLRELLGYDEARIEALRAAGVLAAEPQDGR
jgi:crotonobetainyl-CoA:carnitine CoA-transferase CaiB-like acyl-CoA transferase